MEYTTQEKKRFLKKFRLYIEKYGHLYPSEVLNYILDVWEQDKNLKIKNDVMCQVYAYVGVLPDINNRYKGFLQVIKNNFNIGGNILEVAGGYYPLMSKYIDDEQQKMGKGTITVYDPKLVTDKLGNVKLIKKEFMMTDKVDLFDLIIGISPCQATELIIRKANESKKEFFIALCGCAHLTPDYFTSVEELTNDWYEHIYMLIRSTLGRQYELKTTYLGPQYNYPFPIISTHRQK